MESFPLMMPSPLLLPRSHIELDFMGETDFGHGFSFHDMGTGMDMGTNSCNSDDKGDLLPRHTDSLAFLSLIDCPTATAETILHNDAPPPSPSPSPSSPPPPPPPPPSAPTDLRQAMACPFFNCTYACQFGSDIVRHLFGNKHARAMRSISPNLGYACAECSLNGDEGQIFPTYTALNVHRRSKHPGTGYSSADALMSADRAQKRKNREFIDTVSSMVETANRANTVWLEDLVAGTVYPILRPQGAVGSDAAQPRFF